MAPWGSALSDQQIENVIAFIRTLADPPYQP
jgi:mono/diheme cytochrome c family protein